MNTFSNLQYAFAEMRLQLLYQGSWHLKRTKRRTSRASLSCNLSIYISNPCIKLLFFQMTFNNSISRKNETGKSQLQMCAMGCLSDRENAAFKSCQIAVHLSLDT